MCLSCRRDDPSSTPGSHIEIEEKTNSMESSSHLHLYILKFSLFCIYHFSFITKFHHKFINPLIKNFKEFFMSNSDVYDFPSETLNSNPKNHPYCPNQGVYIWTWSMFPKQNSAEYTTGTVNWRDFIHSKTFPKLWLSFVSTPGMSTDLEETERTRAGRRQAVSWESCVKATDSSKLGHTPGKGKSDSAELPLELVQDLKRSLPFSSLYVTAH